METNRRNFIKSSCAVCLGLAGGSLLSSCSPKLPIFRVTTPGNTLIKVPLSNFSDPKVTMLTVRSGELEYDILLAKNGSGFKSLYLKCTHEGFALTPTTKKIYCNSHGSQFDLNGNVMSEPALKPLETFRTEIIENEINIFLT